MSPKYHRLPHRLDQLDTVLFAVAIGPLARVSSPAQRFPHSNGTHRNG
jgi:hypothetical protein